MGIGKDKVENLFTQTIKINSISDVEKAIQIVLDSKDEYFNLKIEDIEPIIFKFTKGRFDDDFLPVNLLDFLSEYKVNYVKYYKSLTNENIDYSDLKFNLKRNCCEIDFQQLLERAVEKMTGKNITLVLLFGIVAWFGDSAYEKNLSFQKDKYNQEIVLQAINVLEKNIELQNAKNKPVKKAISILNENEKLEYGTKNNTKTYSYQDDDKFNISDDNIIKYEIIEQDVKIKQLKNIDGKKIIVLKIDKIPQFEAISKLNNNEALYNAFENNKKVKLKINVGKNQNNKIVEADIYEVVK